MEQDLKRICSKVYDFVTENEILEQMILSSARDGLERGAEIQQDEKGNLQLANFCTGGECGVRIPYNAARVASFHTHPYTEDDTLSVVDVLSLGDFFQALHHEEVMTCVGQMFRDKAGKESPGVACACLDIMAYKRKLAREVVRQIDG